MNNKPTHLILKKGLKSKLSANFSQSEIDCKCTDKKCCYTLINTNLIKALEKLRASCGNRPLAITSGYRCQSHNASINVLGTKDSKHTIGNAVDLMPPIVNDELKMSLNEFAYRAATFFDKVIIYHDKNFIHCHIEP